MRGRWTRHRGTHWCGARHRGKALRQLMLEPDAELPAAVGVMSTMCW